MYLRLQTWCHFGYLCLIAGRQTSQWARKHWKTQHLEVLGSWPQLFIGWLTNHISFSKGLSSSTKNRHFSNMVATTSRVTVSHRIHQVCIFTYMDFFDFMEHVVKYTIPMDCMGQSFNYIWLCGWFQRDSNMMWGIIIPPPHLLKENWCHSKVWVFFNWQYLSVKMISRNPVFSLKWYMHGLWFTIKASRHKNHHKK